MQTCGRADRQRVKRGRLRSRSGPHFTHVPWSQMKFVFQYISLLTIHAIHRLFFC